MTEPIVYTECYQQVLANAERISRERGDGYVSAQHLMLAILADTDTMPGFEMRHRMGIKTDELARRLTWFLDSPKPGPGEHGVSSLDGSVIIRRNDTLETVASWTPPIVV
jgi:ATP-dependent Clp protease ATP-binding subunit ClpA